MDYINKIKKPIIGFPIISLINKVFEIEGYTHTAEAVSEVVVYDVVAHEPIEVHVKRIVKIVRIAQNSPVSISHVYLVL